ncbi:hypothetical protein EGH25_09990 [Haladaptatus sp. F3-133]|uniref:Uncharacterized protein n=1 Tax=Halorutilus salinus TaxID=2487751 RepID=A0A9Q4C5X2_9EURY|nr:hypothetical protein [Halorutilus salinus]MCX2819677.1 hypothetical protein [Halorutilus salinus]
MDSGESFPTRRGTAYLTDRAVRFEESLPGLVKRLYSGYWKGGTWWRKLMFVSYLLAYPVAVWSLSTVYQRGGFPFVTATVGLLAVLLVLDYARGFRSPDRIPLDSIEGVSITRGRKALTRPRVIIRYSKGGSTYKRRVNLPSLYTTQGEAAYEAVETAFRERGL